MAINSHALDGTGGQLLATTRPNDFVENDVSASLCPVHREEKSWRAFTTSLHSIVGRGFSLDSREDTRAAGLVRRIGSCEKYRGFERRSDAEEGKSDFLIGEGGRCLEGGGG